MLNSVYIEGDSVFIPLYKSDEYIELKWFEDESIDDVIEREEKKYQIYGNYQTIQVHLSDYEEENDCPEFDCEVFILRNEKDQTLYFVLDVFRQLNSGECDSLIAMPYNKINILIAVGEIFKNLNPKQIAF